jgi:hypothetical protein
LNSRSFCTVLHFFPSAARLNLLRYDLNIFVVSIHKLPSTSVRGAAPTVAAHRVTSVSPVPQVLFFPFIALSRGVSTGGVTPACPDDALTSCAVTFTTSYWLVPSARPNELVVTFLPSQADCYCHIHGPHMRCVIRPSQLAS